MQKLKKNGKMGHPTFLESTMWFFEKNIYSTDDIIAVFIILHNFSDNWTDSNFDGFQHVEIRFDLQ